MSKGFAIIAVASVIGLVGGSLAYITLGKSDSVFAECTGGQVAGGQIGGPFTLLDKTGKTVTEKDVITKPTLVYFGYTFCPDVCPMDNARNAEAVDILAGRGLDVQPVFITIDPARDTPEAVGTFAAAFHEKMIGLTGSEEQIKAASQAFKTFYKKQDADDEFYLMDHSTFTYLMLPGIGFVDFFKRDDSAAKMADRVQCFVENAGKAASN